LRESTHIAGAQRALAKGESMKKTTKCLRLNRDTLRLLEKGQLSVVEGRGTKNTLTACDGFANSGCPYSCLC
jgi:hypothetical protein